MLTHTKQNQRAPSMAIHTRASNGERAVRKVYAQLIPAKVSLKGRVMPPMQRMTETCNVKLMN